MVRFVRRNVLGALFYWVEGLLYITFLGAAIRAFAVVGTFLYVAFVLLVLALLFRGFLLFWSFDEPSGPDFYWSIFSIPLWIAVILISLVWGDAFTAIVFLGVGIINVWQIHIKFGLVPTQ